MPRLSQSVPQAYARNTRNWESDPVAVKPWSGRFGGMTDRQVEEFTQSISFDRRLFKQDVQGSIAHANMLARRGFSLCEARARRP